MRFKSKNVVVAYWADTELAFIEIARRLCVEKGLSFSLLKISHHATWFTPQRSLPTNFLHLGKIFAEILGRGVSGRIVSFGTNTCRILFFFSWLFKDIHYVYNELPSFSRWSPAAWIDRAIFRFARNVSVSTIERAAYVGSAYRISRPIDVLENISFIGFPAAGAQPRQGRVLFSGSITSKRFNDEDVNKLANIVERIGQPIDVYGEVAGDISRKFASLIDLKGKVSHAKMLEIMLGYEYGLLSYYTGEPNYDLCAPLKLYEYLAYGCKVISLNRNQGLVELAKRYPALIEFVSPGNQDEIPVLPAHSDFKSQRDRFLSNAVLSNQIFAERVTD